MAIAFACPDCSKTFKVDDDLAGRKATCKKCGTKFRIPASELETVAAGVAAISHTDTVAASGLADEETLRDAPPAKKAPKKSRPKPAPASEPATQEPESSGVASWLDEELATGEEAPKAAGQPCPSCHQLMAGGALLCVHCGYDTRTGEKLASHAEQASGSMIGRLFGKTRSAIMGKSEAEEVKESSEKEE